MQTNFLQSMIANNAHNITAHAALISKAVDDARYERARGETAFMVAKFEAATKLRKQLAKLVGYQRAMLVQLKANYRDARISAKVEKLEAAFMAVPMRKRDMTSYEYEDLLDVFVAAMQQNHVSENVA